MAHNHGFEALAVLDGTDRRKSHTQAGIFTARGVLY